MAKDSDLLSQNQLKMKKYIEIPMEALESLAEGKCLQGSLRRDEWGRIVFKAYRRSPRPSAKVLRVLEHGWVKETERRIKVFESMPKALGAARMMAVIERETKEVKNALIDRELIEFC